MACPICVSPEGSAISDGIRAGAAVLIVVTLIVVGAIVRFGYRLWVADCASRVTEGASRATEGTDGTEGTPAVAHD
jgi:hypothetical protein